MTDKPSAGAMRAACFACGRRVAYSPDIAHLVRSGARGGGKGRARHKCPHGVWCIAGTPLGRQGYNRAPTMGPHACLPCAALARVEGRGE